MRGNDLEFRYLNFPFQTEFFNASKKGKQKYVKLKKKICENQLKIFVIFFNANLD